MNNNYQDDDHKAEQQEDENDRVDNRKPVDFERFGKEAAGTQEFTAIGEFDAFFYGQSKVDLIKKREGRKFARKKAAYLVFSHVAL